MLRRREIFEDARYVLKLSTAIPSGLSCVVRVGETHFHPSLLEMVFPCAPKREFHVGVHCDKNAAAVFPWAEHD